MKLNVRADIRQASTFMKELNQGGINRAIFRALNDTLRTLRKEGAQAIKAAHPALKIGDIKRNINARQAYQNRLVASIDTVGKPLSLKLFGAKVTTKGKVTARIGKGRKREVMHQGRRGFVVAKWGHEIFVRKHKHGRAIRRFRGPSLPGVFRARAKEFQASARKRFPVVLRSRLHYEVEKARRKANASGG